MNQRPNVRYALLVNYPQLTVANVSEEAMEAGKTAFRAYASALTDAGVLRSAEMFQPAGTTARVSVRDGKRLVHDAPVGESTEMLAGVFILDVADLDAAIDWAGKCPAAQWGSVDVRVSALRVIDGEWVYSADEAASRESR